MELVLNTSSLLRSLQLLDPIVSSRSTLPISNDVLIQAREKNTCVLIGTDIETSLRIALPCTVTTPGEICLPAKKLLEAVKELTADELKLRTKDDKAELTCGKVRHTFVGQPAKNHPGMPAYDQKQAAAAQIVIPSDMLSEALTKTVFATSREETRYYLNGVFLTVQKDQARFVATDGRRLAYVARTLENNKVGAQGIIPTKSVHRIADIAAKVKTASVTVAILADHFIMEAADTVFVSRLVQGEFPAYDQVIPRNLPTCTVRAEQLKKGVRQISWVTPEKGWGVRFQFTPGAIRLSAIVEAYGQSEVEVDLQYEGKNLEVKFEPEYILDMLATLPDNAELSVGMNEPSAPWIFQPAGDAGYLYILMPMKL